MNTKKMKTVLKTQENLDSDEHEENEISDEYEENEVSDENV